MRGIGAFGGLVLAAVLSSCTGAEGNVALPVLPGPTWSPEPVAQIELADPRTPVSCSMDPVDAAVITESGARVPLTTDGGDVVLMTPRTHRRVIACSMSGSTRPATKPEERTFDAYADCTLRFDDELKGVDIEATLDLSNGRSPTCFFLASGEPFRFRRLQPGTATLTILQGTSNIELLRVENIMIPETGPVIDARLGALDLRGKVRALRTRLLFPNGDPGSRLLVNAGYEDGHWARVRTDAEGWVSLALPRHMGAPEATVSGFRPVGLFDGYTITLAAR